MPSFNDPRPWVRWWWPGGAVAIGEVRRQLALLAEAGFGGVEIQPFTMALEPLLKGPARDRILSLDQPAFADLVRETIDAAASLGLGVDLTNGSGWPPGGPHIALEDGPRVLAYGEASVRGGRRVRLALPPPRPGLNELFVLAMGMVAGRDVGSFAARHARLLAVAACPDGGGARSLNLLATRVQVPLDLDGRIDLAAHVLDGRLDWPAPPGRWRIVAHYTMPAGEVPTLSAYERAGLVADHLPSDPTALPRHYATLFGDASGVRAVFNDSIELKAKQLATDDILDEFARRRGYRLEPYLPLVHVEGRDNFFLHDAFGVRCRPAFAHPGDVGERVRYDYQRTLSDLLVERFCAPSSAWARAQGAVFRAQTYGFDFDITAAFGAVDIPESEHLFAGGSDLFLRLASSAAMLYRKPQASLEAFTFPHLDGAVTPQRLRAAADQAFAAGINALVMHGAAYRFPAGSAEAASFEEEGWFPWGSCARMKAFHGTDVSPGGSLWRAMPTLNAYFSRTQALLRRGRAEADLLVLYPFLGFPAGYGEAASLEGEPLLRGFFPPEDDAAAYPRSLPSHPLSAEPDERVEWLRAFRPVADALDRAGLTWAWVDEASLLDTTVEGGQLVIRGGRHRALLLSDTPALPPDLAERLAALGREGGRIAFAGEAPSRHPGLDHDGSHDTRVRAAITALRAGNGLFAPDPLSALTALFGSGALRPRFEGRTGLRTQMRVLEGGRRLAFVANLSGMPQRLTIGEPGDLEVYDAWTDRTTPLHVADRGPEMVIPPWSSRFLLPRTEPATSMAGVAPVSPSAAIVVTEWTLVTADGAEHRLEELKNLRDDPDLRGCGSPLTYRARVMLDVDAAHAVIDLGWVFGSASVEINGVAAGELHVPPFELNVDRLLRNGPNELTIMVWPTVRNAYVRRAAARNARYTHHRGRPFASEGLVGPVVLRI